MASQRQLIEAREAYHNLLLGKKAVKLQQNGRLVEFEPADAEKLRSYISQLEFELGSSSGRRGPAGVR